MQHRRRTSTVLALALGASLVIAACGGDDDDTAGTTATEGTESTGTAATEGTDATATTVATEGTETASTETQGTEAATEGSGGEAAAGSLKGVCPDVVTVQTDWMPEAEHGFLYQVIGDGYEVDAGKAIVRGPLLDREGNDTGVQFEVRSGGAAQNFTPVSQILHSDDTALLGFVYTDEGIQFSERFPTIAIESGFEKNPQMIMWDPATYPDVKGIADLGTAGVKIRYFGGAAYMDFFTGTGVLSKDQVDGSYQGDPTLFVSDEGKAAQQGFGSAEPYKYENEIENWMKPVSYEYINDVGWRNYAQSIATKPENVETYRDCFTELVPIIQQASVDYVNDPERANGIILDAIAQFGEDFGWAYSEGTAAYGVKTMKDDGLVANGPNGVVGEFDIDRVSELIELAVPIYTAQGTPPKEGVTPEDIVTNEFIDTSIGF